MERNFYILAHFDDETNCRIDDLTKRLAMAGLADEQTQGLLHHITMATYPPEREQEAIDIFHCTCVTNTPFQIRFDSLGLFGLRVLFLAPNPSQPLLSLRGCLAEEDTSHWCPHATLLLSESPETIKEAILIASEHFKPFAATVTALSLYEFFPSKHIETKPLAIDKSGD